MIDKLIKRLVKRIRASILAWQDYPLRDGTIVGERYALIRCLGMGSYGQAYEALDQLSGQSVLVKVNKPSKGVVSRMLLQRESELMKTLAHPQIPRWLDYCQTGKRDLLVMELVDGDNLETLMLDKGGLYEEKAVVSIMRALLDPLIHLHEHGFVHRDVRIPNVMLHHEDTLTLQERIYLIDFGLACRIGEQLPPMLREALGEESAAFAADESWGQVKRRMRNPDITSDLYGLGHFALFLLYSGYTASEEQQPGDWQTELHLTKAMREWILRSLGDAEPFASAKESAEALDRIMADGQQS